MINLLVLWMIRKPSIFGKVGNCLWFLSFRLNCIVKLYCYVRGLPIPNVMLGCVRHVLSLDSDTPDQGQNWKGQQWRRLVDVACIWGCRCIHANQCNCFGLFFGVGHENSPPKNSYRQLTTWFCLKIGHPPLSNGLNLIFLMTIATNVVP